jgi:phosphoribosyl-ATP pyrophosphohydrolase/phosphoribosyl-AMP cyclohydrolase
MKSDIVEQLKFDANGLVPAVIQDFQSGAVLMVAFMNRESVAKTLETGETHFWSRSRGELWHKGDTSGNIQRVRKFLLDCDNDAVLVQVDQQGNACHTGEYSCFFNRVFETEKETAGFGQVLGSLMGVIEKRKKERPADSYTTHLFQSGIDKILKKIGEESAETIIAAKNPNQKEFVWEVADLVYHLLVLLSARGIGLAEIASELDRRAGKNGK